PSGAKWVLGGFSQGAMVATDVGLRIVPAPDALVLFSGAVVDAPRWQALAPARRGLPVFQSHGREDPILPFTESERLRELLRSGGLEVEYLTSRGGHTITREALERSAALLSGLLR